MIILAPLAAMIVQMAISRTREYGADRGGAEISGKPLALASAFDRISAAATTFPMRPQNATPPWPICSSSIRCQACGLMRCFQPIPTRENRIAALEAIARGHGACPSGKCSFRALEPALTKRSLGLTFDSMAATEPYQQPARR